LSGDREKKKKKRTGVGITEVPEGGAHMKAPCGRKGGGKRKGGGA